MSICYIFCWDSYGRGLAVSFALACSVVVFWPLACGLLAGRGDLPQAQLRSAGGCQLARRDLRLAAVFCGACLS